MGGVPAGSDTFFSVSPAGPGEAECFVIWYGDADARLDPHFHKPLFRNLMQTLKNAGSEPIGALAQYSDEVWDKSDGRFNDVFPYIEISGVSLGTNEYEVASVRIDESPNRARQVVRSGDILISLTRPHRGAVAIVRPEQDGAIASTGFAVVREIDNDKITRDYLLHCLTASFSNDQMLMRSSGGSYPAITREELAKVLIPRISLDSQVRLVAAMDAARNSLKAKLDDADTLLAGIDDFMLDALGIAPPAVETRRVFAVRSQSAANRLDPHFHSPDFTRIERMLSQTHCEPLGNVVTFSKETWSPQEHDQPTFRYIEISGVNPQTGATRWTETPIAQAPSRARMPVHADDIIVSLTAPDRGSIAHLGPEYEGCIASTGFAIISQMANHLRRDYLWCTLRARFCLDQMRQRSSGSLYPAITESELAKILIPVPDWDTQNRIAAEVNRRHEAARRRRADASAGWQAAKEWFEGELLPAQ